jgi:hypothetical protein
MDTATEETVTLKKVLEKASVHLVDQLPKGSNNMRVLP